LRAWRWGGERVGRAAPAKVKGMINNIPQKEKHSFLIPALAGIAIVAVISGILIFYMQHGSHPPAASAQHLPFGADEQAYAQRVHLSVQGMSRASNYLNQDFTYVNGVIANDGVRVIGGAEVSYELKDFSGKIILSESRVLWSAQGRSLEAGQRRDFQITLEAVPDSWNQQYPSIRVTGLLLE
jgi:hypothetical protein